MLLVGAVLSVDLVLVVDRMMVGDDDFVLIVELRHVASHLPGLSGSQSFAPTRANIKREERRKVSFIAAVTVLSCKNRAGSEVDYGRFMSASWATALTVHEPSAVLDVEESQPLKVLCNFGRCP